MSTSGWAFVAILTFSQEQILRNLGAVLEAGGSSLARAVKVNIFLADMGDFAAVNEVYAKHFPDPKPVRLSTVTWFCKSPD